MSKILNFLWDAAVILPAGMILLRFAGKKTLAEMTTLEIITTLAIGTLIGHAVNESGVWKTLLTMMLIILILILAQWIQLNVRWVEKLIIGTATVVIENGKVRKDKLKKLRMTAGQLEMRLRQLGIQDISKVKTATIEANGQLGWELYPDAQPVTYGELMEILKLLHFPADQLQYKKPNKENLFDQVKNHN